MLSSLKHRIKSKDFDGLFGRSRRVSTPYFLISYLKDDNLEFFRFAPVVSKKVSKKAVVRNRLKRRLRGVVRQKKTSIKPNYWIIVSIKPSAASLSAQSFVEEAISALKKADLLT